ncbi:hypothetical protein O181_102447 [Austropuccinia psidii MF-1]|uniref:Uncharacterized protein n=1 Tax=Austropuccinia psidii MF-1 TaxID=1389203 RepID=A0A9Q3PJH2_9BASI|nr:hypothetical protein [Austropuccinia psidii MF-1]
MNHLEWKLSPFGREGMLLRYENDDSSYCFLCPRIQKLLISSHLKLDKKTFLKLSTTYQSNPLTWGDSRSAAEVVDEDHQVGVSVVDEVQDSQKDPSEIARMVDEA